MQAGKKSAVNREILETQPKVGEPGILDAAAESFMVNATSAKETIIETANAAKDSIIENVTAAKDFVMEKVSSVTSPAETPSTTDTITVDALQAGRKAEVTSEISKLSKDQTHA